MTSKYDLAVFIGRFQPFHRGHAAVIREALSIATKVAVIVGSAGSSRSHRNPFTYTERVEMIRSSFPEDASRLFFAPVEDTIYNDELWVKNVQAAVLKVRQEAYGGFFPMAKTTLIGHNKDHSSFYLKLFPQWDATGVEDYKGISSTDIRETYFSNVWSPENPMLHWDGFSVGANMLVPELVVNFLSSFSETEEYKNIKGDFEFVKKYKQQWEHSPFPPMFVTVDAVTVQSGHVLLVKRGARPGKGQWALPGGFLDQKEKIVDGALRELKEETKIKVPLPVLRGNIVEREVFDDPNRSSRGRTITHAFLIHLPAQEELPKIKGSDDADEAKWFPLAEVRRDMMYEDHYDIFLHLTNKL